MLCILGFSLLLFCPLDLLLLQNLSERRSKRKVMKKFKIGALMLVASLLVFAGCSNKVEYTVTFDSNGGSNVESVTVSDGETVTKPKDPTREGYTFAGWYVDLNDASSFDFSTKITSDMKLTAKWNSGTSENSTTTTKKGNTTKKTTKKTTAKTVAVSSVTLNKTALSLVVGKTAVVSATVKPSNATKKDVTWKSSNTSVATVDENGEITAKGVGSATITATAGNKSATVNVTVTARYSIKWTSVPADIAGRSRLQIIDNVNGNAIAGTVTYKYNGNEKTVTTDVDAGGVLLLKDDIVASSMTIKSPTA
jgi:uncharacterized repeat protein (TIGR02543 family)